MLGAACAHPWIQRRAEQPQRSAESKREIFNQTRVTDDVADARTVRNRQITSVLPRDLFRLFHGWASGKTARAQCVDHVPPTGNFKLSDLSTNSVASLRSDWAGSFPTRQSSGGEAVVPLLLHDPQCVVASLQRPCGRCNARGE